MRFMVLVKATRDSEAGVMQIFPAGDFGEARKPGLRAQDGRLRKEVQSRAS